MSYENNTESPIYQTEDGNTRIDVKIENALVEKIEVFAPTHFAFILKSGMRVEEIGGVKIILLFKGEGCGRRFVEKLKCDQWSR